MTSRYLDLSALVFCSSSQRRDRDTWYPPSYTAQNEREAESESEKEAGGGRLNRTGGSVVSGDKGEQLGVCKEGGVGRWRARGAMRRRITMRSSEEKRVS